MSVGTAAIAAAVSLNAKTLAFTGDIAWFRKLVTLTLTGQDPATTANCLFIAYRGTVVVGLGEYVSGAAFTLDLNTTELAAALEDVPYEAERDLTVFLYNIDDTSLELLGAGILKVRQTRDYSGTVPVSPSSGTTLFKGSFAWYNGKTYLRSITDNKYHGFFGYGTGDETTEAQDSVGIDIPGAP